MDTADRFGIARLLDPANVQFSGQQRVNAEIFTAMEILGRKLERSESERDRLARRLAMIESAATVDEKTGKLYLPVVMNKSASPAAPESASSRWVVAASLMSSSIAVFALGLVLFREPMPLLTQDQIAALTSAKAAPQFALQNPDSSAWRHPSSLAQLPDASELTKQEQIAEEPKLAAAEPVETPAAAPAAPPAPAVAEAAPAAEVAAEKTVAAVAVPEPATLKPEEKVIAAVQAPEKKPAPEAKAKPAADTAREFTPDTSLPEKLAQLEKRAFLGIPEAQHDMATVYASGKIVAQNYPRAIYWFTKAADGGIANAHYNLGVIYQQGLGVKNDMTKALGWYEKAAELGHPEAMYNLGIAFAEGIGTAANIEKGLSYFKRAANAGVTQAAYNLGVLYESNLVGAADTGKALEWYQIAANKGHSEARVAVNRLNGTSDQGLTLANTVEPAAGDAVAASSDESPLDENNRALAPKFKSNLLARVQEELVRQGLLSGRPDGVMTPQTEDAIRAHQHKLGLLEDGQPSQELLDKMISSSSNSGN